ncbi:hypothetical protein O6H91_09G027900 [Diphasiastrum complanatum]|uniref:Uncharacterized protein n=1 Tax=Diphasiastrum complanatum TaxID=34168 RepID=A0ACC2CMI5_DIPCM|nr:hypothetical protein O6H91_09G027900 [Diphasiastrum complanatum]
MGGGEVPPSGVQLMPSCTSDSDSWSEKSKSASASESAVPLSVKPASDVRGDSSESRRFLELKAKVLRQNEQLKKRTKHIKDQREKILRYTPGNWLVGRGGTRSGYAIPAVTTLLIVGPVGAGKSTLINNIIRVVDKTDHGFDRAQTYENTREYGTYFLEEYSICESQSICLFDTRGLSGEDLTEDLAVLQTWMREGVHHGQMVVRSSDSSALKECLKSKGRHGHDKLSKKRDVNCVIFVVSAVEVHNMKANEDFASQNNLVCLFKDPYLTFKGFTGRIVDDDCDPTTDMALLEMLEYALQKADRNLPYKITTNFFLKQVVEATRRFPRINDAIKERPEITIAMFWLLLFGLALAAIIEIID